MPQGGTCDVATELFEFLSLLGATPGPSMQAKPLGTDTTLGLRHLLTGETHCRIFPRQHFLSRHQAMEMNIEIGRGPKPLDEGHGAGLCLGMGKAGLVDHEGREGAVNDLQHRRE